MSTAAIVLWVVAGLLFVAAIVFVWRSVRSAWRKLARLGNEVRGLSDDMDQAVGSRFK